MYLPINFIVHALGTCIALCPRKVQALSVFTVVIAGDESIGVGAFLFGRSDATATAAIIGRNLSLILWFVSITGVAAAVRVLIPAHRPKNGIVGASGSGYEPGQVGYVHVRVSYRFGPTS